MTAKAILARETNERLSAGTSFAKFVSHPTKRSAGRISFLKPPAFQFYADDFLAGTFAMTDEEVGQYIRMLCYQWSHGGATQEDLLAHIRSKRISPRVLAKFKVCDDGLLRNERMERVRKEQKAFRLKKKQAGMMGAKKRWQNHASAIVLPMAKNGPPSPISDLQSPINGAQTVVLGKELDRVIDRMKTIKATYGDHQSWSSEDLGEFNKLRVRRTELRSILGVQA